MSSMISADLSRRYDETLAALRKWLDALYVKNEALFDRQGIVRLQPHAAAQFSLGLLRGEPFLAFGATEISWAEAMPWHYAAVYRGKAELNLVAHPLQVDGVATPPFAMSFELRTIADAFGLAAHGSVHLRGGSHSNAGSAALLVSRVPFAEVPVLMLESDDNLFDVGRKNANRAKSRKGRA
jgi:hypothetical protein